MATTTRAPVLVASLAAIVFALGACGSSPATVEGNASAVGRPVEATLTQDSFARVVADAQEKARTARVEVTGNLLGSELVASGAVATAEDPRDSRLRLTATLPMIGEVQTRVVDRRAYLKAGSTTDGKFVAIDLDDAEGLIGRSIEELMNSADPARALAELRNGLQSWEQRGQPLRLDGVRTTPYVLKVDVRERLAAAGRDAPAHGGLPETVTTTLWLGPDQLPRRIVHEAVLPMAGAVELQTDLSAWGQPVTVEKPVSEQITDADLLDDLVGFGAA